MSGSEVLLTITVLGRVDVLVLPGSLMCKRLTSAMWPVRMGSMRSILIGTAKRSDNHRSREPGLNCFNLEVNFDAVDPDISWIAKLQTQCSLRPIDVDPAKVGVRGGLPLEEAAGLRLDLTGYL